MSEWQRAASAGACMRNDNEWILTYTGKQFWPLDPRQEDICIEDIAHALSNICRFNGHTYVGYSVAQHCVLASEYVDERYAPEALLHDASEAYLCDLPRPLKSSATMLAYREAEYRLERVIQEKFSLYGLMNDEVKDVDNRLLFTERRDLMPPGVWIIDESLCYEKRINPWGSTFAEQKFLDRFEELTCSSSSSAS